MRTVRTNPEPVAAPMGTYSHAVRVETGDTVWIFVSGQVPVDAEGQLVGQDDAGAQTEQIFENLRHILAANGAGFADVVKIQTFYTTLEDLEGSREVRARYFPTEPPASTAVQVAALLLPGAILEVDVVAAIPA